METKAINLNQDNTSSRLIAVRIGESVEVIERGYSVGESTTIMIRGSTAMRALGQFLIAISGDIDTEQVEQQKLNDMSWGLSKHDIELLKKLAENAKERL